MRWLRRNVWGVLVGTVLLSLAILLISHKARIDPSLIDRRGSPTHRKSFQKTNLWFSKHFKELGAYFVQLEDSKNKSLKKQILQLNNDLNALSERVAETIPNLFNQIGPIAS